MGGTIREVMSRDPRTVDSGASAVDAARAMRDEDVGVIPVVESDRLVADVASRELVTIDPDQDLDEALRLMAKHQVRRLPVVEEDGKLVGIVAQADIAKHASASQTGEVVEKISN